MICFGLLASPKPAPQLEYDGQCSAQALLNVIISRLRQYRKLMLSLAACLCLGTSAQAGFEPINSDNSTDRQKRSLNVIKHHSTIDKTAGFDGTYQTFNVSMSQLSTSKLSASSGTDPLKDSPLKDNTKNRPPTTVLAPALNEPSLYALLEAEFAASRGDINRALTLYKQQSFKEDATAVFERALSLSLRHEAVESSLEFAKTWQAQNPDHVPAWFYVAHLALKAHDYTLAGETLGLILRYDPRTDLSEILIGIYPTTDSDQRELLAALQPIDSEQNASLSVLKAGLLNQFDESEVALVHINRALMLQPDYVPFLTLKADILRKIEPAETVISYVSQARLRNPDSKSLYLYEIRYLLDLKQSQAAWELLLDTHKRFSEDTEITLLTALVSLDIEAYSTAERLLNILAKHPDYLDQAYYYLGISAERQQRFEQAKSYLNEVIQEDLVLSARKKVVDLELLFGNVDAAIATLEKLRKQFEVFAPDTYVLQADILWQHGQEAQALALLTDASRNYPDNEMILFARTQLLDDVDDYIVKRTLLNHLQALDPNNPSYQLNFAQLLLSNEQNSKQGLALARAITERRFDDPRYDRELHLQALNLLANNALANKNYLQVIDYLQTPYNVLPTLRSGVLLLRAYQGMGDNDKVEALLADLQQRFSFGQQNVSDRVQLY